MISRRTTMTRREWLACVAGAAIASPARAAAAWRTTWTPQRLPSTAPLKQIRAGQAGALLAIGADGVLWSYETAGSPVRLADGIDPTTPLASGYGRIAARRLDGGLLVHVDHRNQSANDARLAIDAGLAILPFAIIGIVTDGPHFRVVRFEPEGAHWAESDRSGEAVMPDARPVMATLDRPASADDPGEVVVFAGPDTTRYDHGVLGDRIEATRLLWLDRHSLRTLREMTLPTPYVFEDIAPRVVTTDRGVALMTMRSGGAGTQLALVTADPVDANRLRIAALGDPIGGAHRWLAPTTDGHRLMAIHTPHVGGILNAYRIEGDRLRSTVIASDVANHRIGTRELDLAVWRGTCLIVPAQDGRRLRVFDGARQWAEQPSIDLPARVVMSAALLDETPFDGGTHGVAFAVLLDDGTAYRFEQDR